ncbi:hypothetical protein [Roseococcus sp. YIM B11640]|uniref:COG3904 family protein n=1 Tax=Roseococcus sp. YIM B11640 TaxID=3133973 RepID=UPI003C7B090A
MFRTLALPFTLTCLVASLAPLPLLAQSRPSAPGSGGVFVSREGGRASIVVTGRISPETETAFAAAVRSNPNARVVLNSAGGSLNPALAMGRLIHERRLQTVVPDGRGCFSACGLIWIAGAERHIGTGARIGFHAAYVPQQGGPGQVSSSGNAVIGAYLSRLGFNDNAIRFLTAARPEQISVVKPQQFAEMGVTVRNVATRMPDIPDTPAAAQPGGTGKFMPPDKRPR